MDTTIRNLDEKTYRQLKARAALTGKTVGEALNEAIRHYVARPIPAKTQSILDLRPKDLGRGSKRLSEESVRVGRPRDDRAARDIIAEAEEAMKGLDKTLRQLRRRR